MRVTGCAVLIVALGLCAASTATAQEKGQVGVTFAYPSSVGMIWHVSDRVAFLPGLSFSRAWTDRTDTEPLFGVSTSSFSSSSWSVGVSVGARFYLKKQDALIMYVSPEYGFSRLSYNSTSIAELDRAILALSGSPTRASTDSIVTTAQSAAGSIGAQYTLGQRFGIYGDAGLRYSRSKSPSFLGTGDARVYGIGIRAGVGVLLYF